MALGYYKHKMKEEIVQIWKRFNYRRNNIIQKGVFLGKEITLLGNVYVGYNTRLEMNVVLSRNVRVGNNANLSNISVGENSHIESKVLCTGFGQGKIVVGKESAVGIGCILDWSDNIIIGNYVHTCGHLFTHSSVWQALMGDPLKEKKRRDTSPIVIEDNVYIGYGCIVYPGVSIRHHVIVLPNSIVNKEVPSYTMVGGAPAKVIKKLNRR